jgi:uncharacterized protein (DUF488 family)
VTSNLATRSSRSQHHSVGGRIYSVGYEGLELAGLVDHLKSARVTTLVDVRLTPVSRKRGFSRKSLSAELEKAGITYIHEKALGNPPDNRDSFRQDDGDDGRRRMREMLDNGSGPALQRLVELARHHRVVVLCVEREEGR